jgi:hypothetical protein
MSLKILSHLFTGPFDLDDAKVRFNQDPVVFAIVCRDGQPWNPEFSLIAVDKSGSDGVVFKDHLSRGEWENACEGRLGVYFLPCPKADKQDVDPRNMIVDEICEALEPPGGLIPIQGMM